MPVLVDLPGRIHARSVPLRDVIINVPDDNPSGESNDNMGVLSLHLQASDVSLEHFCSRPQEYVISYVISKLVGVLVTDQIPVMIAIDDTIHYVMGVFEPSWAYTFIIHHTDREWYEECCHIIEAIVVEATEFEDLSHLFQSDCIRCKIGYEDMNSTPAYLGCMGRILYVTTSSARFLSYVGLHESAIAMKIGEEGAALNLLHSFEGHQVVHGNGYEIIRLDQLGPVILRQLLCSSLLMGEYACIVLPGNYAG